MAQKGQKIEELYVSLGMDVSELDVDLALADKTVSEGLAALNRKMKHIRLQADIDTNGLTGARAAVQKLEIQEKSLSQQLSLQKQRIDILNAAYRQSVQETGAASAASQRLETRLLQERRAYSQLEVEIRKTAAEQSKMKGSQGLFGGILGNTVGGALEQAKTAKTSAMGLMGGLSGIATKATAALAFVEAGAGLMNVTQGAMQAGDTIYKLSQRMHLSTDEAAKMNAMFKLAGTDAMEATPALTRLDRAILTAGANGNDTTKALQRFGVSLTDSRGRLLPMNEQLQALARGYQRASESGQEEAFAAEVLGRNGQALIPVLADMDDLLEATADIQTTGLLNPDDCHALTVTWKKMQVETGQLKLALGAALIPVAQDIMPDLIDLVKDLVSGIRENKDNIKYLAEAFILLARVSVDGLRSVLSFLDKLGINAKNVKKVIDGIIFSIDTLAKAREQFKAGDFQGVSDTIENADFASWQQEREAAQQAAEAAKKAAEAAKRAKKEQQGAIQQVTQATREEEAAAKKAAEAERKAAEEAARANQELAEKLYGLTHSQMEVAVHKVDVDSDTYRSRGADESLVLEVAEREKAKIQQEFAENTVAKLDAVWKSELQNRLDDIDREKRAYIQKGIDEVKAAAWAGHEKRLARQKEALAAFKENREYLEIMRQAMAGEGTMEEKLMKARTAMLLKMREKSGITDADRTSPEEMNLFSRLMGEVQHNLVPGLEENDWAKLMDAHTVRVARGTQVSREVPGITIHVHADFKDSYVDSEAAEERFINKMGKRMAPQVAQAVSQTLGGGFNRY